MSRRSNVGEFEAIELLRRQLASTGVRQGEIGIGDDAAVLRRPGGRLVWSIDASLQGVHFDTRWLSLREAAARAFVAALSDLAAMGARPTAALCALGLPAGVTAAQVRAIGRGQADVASEYGCALVGGNVTRDARVSFVTTVLGEAKRVVGRSGARPGQEVWLCGNVGEAAAGLELLRQARPARGVHERRCIRAWRAPRARFDEASTLCSIASALIDVSDGVASEAQHIAHASGVRLVLDDHALEALCTPSLRQVCERLGKTPLDLMLHGGEDYALLATGPARRRPSMARVVGSVTDGNGAWLRQGQQLVRLAGGHDHLRNS